MLLIKTDPTLIQAYLEDYSGLTGAHTQAVIYPSSANEISQAVEEASRSKIPITVSGAGTGVTGGRLPFGGRVLTTEKLNKIIDVVPTQGNSSVIIQPGVTLAQLDAELKKYNLWYPVNPTEQSATLGGNVSTNASGSHSFAYGTTRRYVRRLTVVLATGEIITVRRGTITADEHHQILLQKTAGTAQKISLPSYTSPDIKNAAGYFIRPGMDLIDLFIGHEGTLGVIAEIELSVIPRPENSFHCCLFFPEDFPLVKFITELKTRSRTPGHLLSTRCIEYADHNCLELLKTKYPSLPTNAGGFIYGEQECSPENEDALLNEWVALFERFAIKAENVLFAQTEKDKTFLTELRHSIPESINTIVKRNGMPKIGSDLAVPEQEFPEMFARYPAILGAQKIPFYVFGHIGDSHVHANILPSTKQDYLKSQAAYDILIREALARKGTVSAEHGIGKIKHRYLAMMYDKTAIKGMAKVKKQLDPSMILGRGNIFPQEYLCAEGPRP